MPLYVNFVKLFYSRLASDVSFHFHRHVSRYHRKQQPFLKNRRKSMKSERAAEFFGEGVTEAHQDTRRLTFVLIIFDAGAKRVVKLRKRVASLKVFRQFCARLRVFAFSISLPVIFSLLFFAVRYYILLFVTKFRTTPKINIAAWTAESRRFVSESLIENLSDGSNEILKLQEKLQYEVIFYN